MSSQRTVNKRIPTRVYRPENKFEAFWHERVFPPIKNFHLARRACLDNHPLRDPPILSRQHMPGGNLMVNWLVGGLFSFSLSKITGHFLKKRKIVLEKEKKTRRSCAPRIYPVGDWVLIDFGFSAAPAFFEIFLRVSCVILFSRKVYTTWLYTIWRLLIL